MPALRGKDIPPGNWARRAPTDDDDEPTDDVPAGPWIPTPKVSNPLVWYRRRPSRISRVRCAGCGTRLHQILVDDGERYHYLCNPEG